MKPTSRVRQSAEHAKALLEVTSLLEMMHAMISRMGARESRAAKKILDEGLGDAGPGQRENVLPSGTVSAKDRKQLLREYVAARRYGGGGAIPPAPPQAPEPPAAENPNGDEQLELEDEP